MDEMFSDDAFAAVNGDTPYTEIVSLGEVRQIAQTMGNEDPYIQLRAQLEVVTTVGMELIDLEWNYNGETYHSLAIADNTNGGIFYDHIGHMVT